MPTLDECWQNTWEKKERKMSGGRPVTDIARRLLDPIFDPGSQGEESSDECGSWDARSRSAGSSPIVHRWEKIDKLRGGISPHLLVAEPLAVPVSAPVPPGGR